MDDNPQDGQKDSVNNGVKPGNNQLPKLRPYQIPEAERKIRDEKEAAERSQRIKELREESEHPKKKHRLLRFLGWILLIIVLTGGIGGAAWYYLLRQPMAEVTSEAASKNQPAAGESSSDTKKGGPIDHYESTNFSLAIDHPAAWTHADTTAKLTITSPSMQLKDTSGAKKSAQVVVTIQKKQASTPAFKAGNATAMRESEKMAYAKPSPNQRANSYLSFLGYADSTSKGLDGIYVTGDNGYQKDQAIPQVDIAKADPLITVTFNTCGDSKCATAGKPLTIAPSMWDDNSFAAPIRSMLQSIVVQ